MLSGLGLKLVDGVGGAAAGKEGGEDDLAAVFFHRGAADDFLVGVVIALDEDVGDDRVDEGGGGVFFKEDDVIDGLQGREYGEAIVLIVERASGAFQAFDGGVGIHADDEEIALAAGEGEVLDVADVEDVEDAVGENDFWAGVGCSPPTALALATTMMLEVFEECGEGADFSAGVGILAVKLIEDFVFGDGDDAEFFDFEAAGDVGEHGRVEPGSARGDGHDEGGEDHVAGTGDVVDVARTRGDGGGSGLGRRGYRALEEIHALFVEGEKAGLQVQRGEEGVGDARGVFGGGEFEIAAALGFVAVGRDDRHAGVF